MKKEKLKIISKTTIAKNQYKYEFIDTEGKIYVWNTKKEYWFKKFEWWDIAFKEVEVNQGIIYINNCRISRHI